MMQMRSQQPQVYPLKSQMGSQQDQLAQLLQSRMQQSQLQARMTQMKQGPQMMGQQPMQRSQMMQFQMPFPMHKPSKSFSMLLGGFPSSHQHYGSFPRTSEVDESYDYDGEQAVESSPLSMIFLLPKILSSWSHHVRPSHHYKTHVYQETSMEGDDQSLEMSQETYDTPVDTPVETPEETPEPTPETEAPTPETEAPTPETAAPTPDTAAPTAQIQRESPRTRAKGKGVETTQQSGNVEVTTTTTQSKPYQNPAEVVTYRSRDSQP
jgi:hypothetical protein